MKFYRLSAATFYDLIYTLYQFIKLFLDKKYLFFRNVEPLTGTISTGERIPASRVMQKCLTVMPTLYSGCILMNLKSNSQSDRSDTGRDLPVYFNGKLAINCYPCTLCLVVMLIKPASVAQLDAPSDWRPGGRGFNPRRGRQHSFVEIDHEIFSTVILSLPLIQEGQLSVSGERMCTVLVNHLED